MARVYEGKHLALDRLLGPVERLIYRLTGVHPDHEMEWKGYAVAMLLFNAAGALVLYSLQRLQGWLPLNPQRFGAIAPDLAFNTAISFIANANWQAYGGETAMSYLTQMAGLAVQNFASAASGMAVLVAFIRGLARRSSQTLGNFWVDLTRGTLYILLPLSLVMALALVSQGVVQTFVPYPKVQLVQPTTYDAPVTDPGGKPVLDEQGRPKTRKTPLTEQVLAVGPAASQIAIKHIGTNGGGFFNANSAHPFENPTPFANFLELLAITLIPVSLCHTFGVTVKDTRQGWAILAAMIVIFTALVGVVFVAEQSGNPLLAKLAVDQRPSPLQAGGNMEGKEARFGIVATALFVTGTTGGSGGAMNSLPDSLTPLGGLVPMLLIQLGEVMFGSIGSGLYGMLMFVLVAVFVAGLMVGRTPEYLGKKIEVFEMKMAALFLLIGPAVILVGTAIAVMTPAGRAGISNPGPHGFSQVLYAFSSANGHNGSAFAGLNANTIFYNIAIALAIFFGRYWMAIPPLAIAGSMVRKNIHPAGIGTLPTHTPLFVTLLVGTVLLVGALSFLPALALGPIAEHLAMIASQ
jgi:K+-transporting ATPase ATPase A chain